MTNKDQPVDELREQVAIKLGYVRQEQHSNEKVRWYDLDEYGNPTDVTKRLDDVMELLQAECNRARLDELRLLDCKTWLTAADVQTIIDKRIAELQQLIMKYGGRDK